MGEHSEPQQISLHESRGISYINTGRAINNMTIHHMHYLPRLYNHICFTTQYSPFVILTFRAWCLALVHTTSILDDKAIHLKLFFALEI